MKANKPEIVNSCWRNYVQMLYMILHDLQQSQSRKWGKILRTGQVVKWVICFKVWMFKNIQNSRTAKYPNKGMNRRSDGDEWLSVHVGWPGGGCRRSSTRDKRHQAIGQKDSNNLRLLWTSFITWTLLLLGWLKCSFRFFCTLVWKTGIDFLAYPTHYELHS